MKSITTLLLVLCVTICNAQITDPERKERFWVGKSELLKPSVVSGDFGTFVNDSTTIDSVVVSPDGIVQFYYSNELWKKRFYALHKLRSYGYFRIPLHKRKQFIKAEKEYKELMKRKL